MSLIDKLRDWGESLFNSKKAYIAQQSLPTESFVSQVSVPNDEGNHSYISPIDGWVQYMPINGNATNVQLHYQNVHSVMASGVPFTFYGFVPVQKGVEVLARSSGDSGVLLFIRSIGGGLSSILQSGGALCLRLKTILYQSAILLTKDPFHQTNLLTFSLRKQAKLMSRPLMAMLSVLSQISLMLKQSILATGNLLYRLFLATLTHGAVFGCHVKKGILLQLTSRVLADRHFDLYSRGTAQANLAFEGGAL